MLALVLDRELEREAAMIGPCHDFRTSRRALIRAGVAGFAGLSLPGLLRAEEAAADGAGIKAKAKSVIFLHQFGGPSHIDTFDLKPGAPDGIRGSFKPIASDPSPA
jgi:hypothetical protein